MVQALCPTLPNQASVLYGTHGYNGQDVPAQLLPIPILPHSFLILAIMVCSEASSCICRVSALGKTVEEVLSSRKHPGLLKQLNDNIDSLQKSRCLLHPSQYALFCDRCCAAARPTCFTPKGGELDCIG